MFKKIEEGGMASPPGFSKAPEVHMGEAIRCAARDHVTAVEARAG